MSARLKSPLTGIVVNVLTKVGDLFGAGDCLIILESMKMEFNVDAPSSGVVEQVWVKAGDTVQEGDTLLTLGSRS